MRIYKTILFFKIPDETNFFHRRKRIGRCHCQSHDILSS